MVVLENDNSIINYVYGITHTAGGSIIAAEISAWQLTEKYLTVSGNYSYDDSTKFVTKDFILKDNKWSYSVQAQKLFVLNINSALE